MGKVKVQSLIRDGSVFVRCGDIIKTFYVDLSDFDDPKVKLYITDCIKKWEKYEEDVISEHKNHIR
jgi:hypothetical protein